MKLRLGQPVHSSDRLFGELADIVVDPVQRKVTHVVIEPHDNHSQARLVPIWLVTCDGDVLHVALGDAFIRQLQRVAFDDFVAVDDGAIEVGGAWDIAAQDVIAPSYVRADDLLANDLELVPADRIPKGECDIRRRSEVTTADYQVVGHVDAMVADDDDLVAVVVETGLPGLRQHIVVPMSAVANVFNDEILLAIDRRDFLALPRTEAPGSSASPKQALDSLRRRSSRLARRALHRRNRQP